MIFHAALAMTTESGGGLADRIAVDEILHLFYFASFPKVNLLRPSSFLCNERLTLSARVLEEFVFYRQQGTAHVSLQTRRLSN